MSNSFLTRLRSQVRQSGSQAEAAASVLGPPKTPVQYVRAPAGPSAPLPNPFAGVLESSQASPLQAPSPTAQQAESSSTQAQLLLEGQPLLQPQPSAAQRKAAKSSKWEMLLEPDEPEQSAEAQPSAHEQSAPSAAQPKMAMRFQMMIDSQELESKRQRGNSNAPQGPSLSAAVYPTGTPQQGSMPQHQGHHSMPPLLSSLAQAKQQHRRKPKPWEMLLAAQDSEAGSGTSTAAPDNQQQGTSEPQSAENVQHGAQAPDQAQARPSAVDHSQMIARWERMLDKRSSRQSSSASTSSTASLGRQPSQRDSDRAVRQSSLRQLGSQQSISGQELTTMQQQTGQAEVSASAAGEASMQPLVLKIPSVHSPPAQATGAASAPPARLSPGPALSGGELPQSSRGGSASRDSMAVEPEQYAESSTARPESSAGVESGDQRRNHSPVPLQDREKVPPYLCAACCLPRALWLPSSLGKASHPCIPQPLLQHIHLTGQCCHTLRVPLCQRASSHLGGR